MPRLAGKVGFITGAARGQGRARAILMAEEGADLVLVDVSGPATAIDYPSATAGDRAETVRMAEQLGRRVVLAQADVRDLSALEQLGARGVSELGRLDVVVANAGIATWGQFWEMPVDRWRDMIDIT